MENNAITSAQRPDSIGSQARNQDRSLGGSCQLPQNISEAERWASAVGGSVLLLSGLLRGSWGGLVMGGIGGALVYRGVTGHCHGYDALGIDTAKHNSAAAVPAQQGVKVEKTITINRSPADLYRFWSNLEQLPSVMQHLNSVTKLEGKRSLWVAQGPLSKRVQWEAETINQRENEMIAWRSLPGGDVDSAGSVHFEPKSNKRGTAVKISLKYNPPAGKVGAAVAWLMGSDLEQELNEDLRRFKSFMEAGEVPTHG